MGILESLLTSGLGDLWRAAKKHLPPCSLCTEAAVFRCANCGGFVCHMHAFASAAPIRAVCHRCMATAFPWANDCSQAPWPYAEAPWEVLGVSRHATVEEIKVGYRTAAQRCHPDHGGDPADMVKVNAAYEALSRGK